METHEMSDSADFCDSELKKSEHYFGFLNYLLFKLIPTIHDSAKQMVDILKKSNGQEINLHKYCREYAIDLILRLVMG
jgi:hypothetical protein